MAGRNPGERVGRVSEIIQRAKTEVVGDLRREGRNFIVAPDDPRFIYEVAVPDPTRSGLKPAPQPGDKVVVKLGEWRRREQPLVGEITQRLGRTHEPRAELLGIYIKHGLEPNFPAEVEKEAAAIPAKVQPHDLTGRLDYRKHAVFTIDPDDAKDFGHALSIEDLGGGLVKVGIHIADVSHYVKPGTPLDREARQRGNSTYLVGTVIPMLPEKLSNGLCSLVEAQDRLCKAVFLTFGPDHRIRETHYANTVIRSRKRLTYRQAYALLFEDDLEKIRALPLPPKHQTGSTGRALRDLPDSHLLDLQSWIRALWRIASSMRKHRMAHGSLDLDMPETKIFVDPEGYADRLERIEQDESHQLIEEFMLAANEAVAHLTRTHRLPSLYRVHDQPDAEKLADYRQFVSTFGIKVGDLTRREEVVKLLQILKHHPQGYTLRTQFLRSLKKACYRATPDGHFGLHKKDYTHFTSPIRRYSDLVVHQVLQGYLTKGAARYDVRGINQLADHLSLTEINSTNAERESVKLKKLEYFQNLLHERAADDDEEPTTFPAVVVDVRNYGLLVELPEFVLSGLVHVSELDDDFYHFDAVRLRFIGKRRKKVYGIGDHIRVEVANVDTFKRQVDFRIAT